MGGALRQAVDGGGVAVDPCGPEAEMRGARDVPAVGRHELHLGRVAAEAAVAPSDSTPAPYLPASFGPVGEAMRRFLADPAEIDRILGQGADRADAIARPILEKAYEIVGMVRSR